MNKEQRQPETRTISAPQPHGAPSGTYVIQVQAAPDEVVLWHWSHRADGVSLVTGYTIVKEAELDAATATD